MSTNQLFTSLTLILFILAGCSDNATVINHTTKKLSCLALEHTADKELYTLILKQYNFDQQCPYKLQIARKSNIVCNSHYNADKKALSNFPSGFIRLDIYYDGAIIYSYYKDLDHRANSDDIDSAFNRLQHDLF